MLTVLYFVGMILSKEDNVMSVETTSTSPDMPMQSLNGVSLRFAILNGQTEIVDKFLLCVFVCSCPRLRR